jgi:hypothetical protein
VAANGSLFTNGNSNAPSGNQVAFLQRLGTILQTIAGLQPGASYTLFFKAAQRATGANWNFSGQTWDVAIDSNSIASFAPDQSATSYTEYNVRFTATMASHTLTFIGTNLHGGDNTVFIDDVRIVRDSPPLSDHEIIAPTLEIAKNGDNAFDLSINSRHSVPGHEYVLQASDDLSAENWQTISDPQSGTGGNVTFFVPSQAIALRQFFRIMIRY